MSGGGDASVDDAVPARRMGKSASTIYDIAALAGVNPSTVSRALNRPGRVSARTQKKIEDAARSLDYKVNVFARALPTGRTQTIGLIVPDLSNPAFLEIVRGAEAAASACGYTLMLGEASNSAEVELALTGRMLAAVDGVILASPQMEDAEIDKFSQGKPLVLVNRHIEGVESVLADTDAGVAEAVRNLLEQGHGSFAYVAGLGNSWLSEQRWASIRARCDWSGADLSLVTSGAPTVDGGRRAATAVRSSGATAVFCYNDLMAIGLMRELQLAGIRIPDDVSILGFDNIFGSDFTTPPLSTIKTPLLAQGQAAVQIVLGRVLASKQVEARGPLLTELVLRGSSGPVAGR